MFRVCCWRPKRSFFTGFLLIPLLCGCTYIACFGKQPPRNSFFGQPSPRLVARFASFTEAETTLGLYAGTGLPGSASHSEEEWDNWIRAQDSDIRSRIDRGTEDSISNFLLYGTSFTRLPRLSSGDEALDSAGAISPAARSRAHALAAVLQGPERGERIDFVRQFFVEKEGARKDWESALIRNLLRFVQEQRAYQRKLEDAGKSGDTTEVMSVRGTLFEKRGLSVDTSLLPNFAIEETLRAMVNKGVVKPKSMSRIAIVGPGLDFTDKRDGYDFYPLQTLQPFAVLESVKRLGLAGPDRVQVVTLDLNGAVNAHVAHLAARGRKRLSYIIQLPRDERALWSDAAVAYWKEFGVLLGSELRPLRIPDALPSVSSRAVAVRPEYAAAITAVDLNIVTQTLDAPENQGFDLVVATNILVYYDVFQQALAMSNIAHMMNSGGIFLANNALPTAHDPRLKYLGRKNVVFAQDGSYGDDVVVYQRQ